MNTDFVRIYVGMARFANHMALLRAWLPPLDRAEWRLRRDHAMRQARACRETAERRYWSADRPGDTYDSGPGDYVAGC